MNILCDFHHSSLYSSFLYTLETRLGHSVYRQISERWFTEGFWKINKQKDTIAQYLGTYGYQPSDGTPPLNNTMWVQDGIYYSKDPNTGQVHKAITFEKFMEMDFDIIIASIPQHIRPFKQLAQLKKAKFILQMGNNWEPDWSEVDNLMASTMPRQVPVNSIFYHQEFDERVFKFEKHDLTCFLEPFNKYPYTMCRDTNKKPTIANFMNVLQNYPEAQSWFEELEKEMPDYDFKMYGSQNRDGCITGVENLANAIHDSRWIFHIKPGGDGYGHLVHNFFACGRPLITNKSFYEGHLAGRMMTDKNCILIDSMSPKQAADVIRAHEEKHEEMCKNARHTFEDFVNFEKDAINIQTFLDNLR